jgi:hypothetical protein
MSTYFPYEPAPDNAMGPRPKLGRLPDSTVATLLKYAENHDDRERRARAAERFSIWTETFREVVAKRIDQRWDTKDTKVQLGRHVSMALNVGLDLARQICVVWKHGARRTVEEATEDENEALAKLILSAKFAAHAPVWNQLAFLVGAIIVVPVLRRGELRWDTLLPHHYTVVPDPEDPHGMPLAVTWRNTPDPFRTKGEQADRVVLDAEAWWYYNTQTGSPKLVHKEIHGLGEFPGEPLRFDLPGIGTDWYGLENDRVFDVTVDVAILSAQLSWVRKSQCHFLLAMIGQLQKAAKGQIPSPEQNIGIDVPKGSSVTLQAIGFDTDPKNFIRHVLFLKEQVAEAFGIPGSAITFDFNSGSESERLRVTHEGLTEIRDTQIPFCRDFEHGLIRKSVLMARAYTPPHRLAPDLPTNEQITQGYRVHFPKLGRVFNDPQTEMDYIDWEISKGWTSREEEMRKRNPSLTDKQIRTLQDKFLEEEIRWINELAKRDKAANPDGDLETLDQAAGRQGGLTRASNAVEDKPPEGE